MKKFIFIYFILSIITLAQTKGVVISDAGKVWYDSVYNADKSKTIDFNLKYALISIVLENKSETITNEVQIYSVTQGYNSVRPFNAVSYVLAGVQLRTSDGSNISSDETITLAPGTKKEYFVINPAIQLLEIRLINDDATAVNYFYAKGVKD